MRRIAFAGLLALGLAAALPAAARTKLITLPVREKVEIQLDHPSATLVEEERIVPLVSGVNEVDFSWANTPIDPSTILLRVVAPAGGQAGDVKVLSVSYPPGESALVWSLGSAASGPVRIRISYLVSNLNDTYTYRAVAGRDEASLTLNQYLRLSNLANEDFGSAALFAGFGPDLIKPIGLNETIEVLVRSYAGVPVKKSYTVNPAEHGYIDRPQNKLKVPMFYVLKNEQAGKMGEAALPEGKVRIFQDDGKGSTAFLGEDWGKFTPIDQEMRLYLGVAQDIVVKRTIDRNQQKRIAGNLYDYEMVVKYEIENFKGQVVTLDLVEDMRALRGETHGSNLDPQWELGKETTLGSPDAEKGRFDKLTFHAELPPAKDGKAQKIVHKLHVTFHNEFDGGPIPLSEGRQRGRRGVVMPMPAPAPDEAVIQSAPAESDGAGGSQPVEAE